MLIVGGTSLAVYPAAGLIDYYRGNKLVLTEEAGGRISGAPGTQAPRQAERVSSVRVLVMDCMCSHFPPRRQG